MRDREHIADAANAIVAPVTVWDPRTGRFDASRAARRDDFALEMAAMIGRSDRLRRRLVHRSFRCGGGRVVVRSYVVPDQNGIRGGVLAVPVAARQHDPATGGWVDARPWWLGEVRNPSLHCRCHNTPALIDYRER